MEKTYTINLTPIAIEKAKEQLIKRNNPDTKGIRIALRGGKCNGFSLIIEFADKITDKDHIFEFNGVSIYVDPKSIIYLDGTMVDYAIKLMGSGFTFNVPNKKGSCGCGESINF